MKGARFWLFCGAMALTAVGFAAPHFAAAVELAQATASPRPGVVFSASEKHLIRKLLGAAGLGTGDAESRETHEDERGRSEANGHGHGRGKGLPPGLAKRESLPPGLARQVERNGKLPPGLQKRRLPSDIEARLPKTARGTERLIVGHDVVLVDKSTQTVLDIIRDVIDVISSPKN